jgi:hypothetical protein
VSKNVTRLEAASSPEPDCDRTIEMPSIAAGFPALGIGFLEVSLAHSATAISSKELSTKAARHIH